MKPTTPLSWLILWALVVMGLAVSGCGKVSHEGSRWRNQDYPSADAAYVARVSERINGDANETTFTISIIDVPREGPRSETKVYFGEAGQRYSVVWTKDREVTIAVPGMIESSDQVGAVTVKFVELVSSGS